MKIQNYFFRRIGATLIGVLLLIYVGYQVYLINYVGLTTETATYAEVSDTIQSSGWIIRNETVIKSSQSGVLSYNYADGEKVSLNGNIADIYATEEDARTNLQIEKINDEIASLQSLKDANDYFSANPELIGTQIDDTVTNMLTGVINNDYNYLSDLRPQLLSLLNQKGIILGNENTEDFAAKIYDLNDEKNALVSNASGRIDYISSPASGYFISSLDGYENSFDYDNIADMSVNDINNISKGSIEENASGKICGDFAWYIALVINESQKIKLEKFSNVYIEIPFAYAEQIPAEVVSINLDESTGQYAAILKCNYMNKDIAAIRNETVQVIINTYSGVLVNQKSIHFEDVTVTETDENGNETEVVHENVKGVYVKSGSRITFVQIFSDITINGYAVCKTSLNSTEEELLKTDRTIVLYDEVVTEGTNLYDGKLL